MAGLTISRSDQGGGGLLVAANGSAYQGGLNRVPGSLPVTNFMWTDNPGSLMRDDVSGREMGSTSWERVDLGLHGKITFGHANLVVGLGSTIPFETTNSWFPQFGGDASSMSGHEDQGQMVCFSLFN